MSTMVGHHAIRYVEGGNRWAAIIAPVGLIASIIYYTHVVGMVSPWQIDTQVVLSYVFNLFAIEFGALVSLFALLACRPTEFIQRMQKTRSFGLLMSNIKYTMAIGSLGILVTFVLGTFKVEPAKSFDFLSFCVLFWVWGAIGVTMVYARTIRLIFIALA